MVRPVQGWGRRVVVAAVAGVAALGLGGCLRPAAPQAAPAGTGTVTPPAATPTTPPAATRTTPPAATPTTPPAATPTTLTPHADWRPFTASASAWEDWEPVLSGVRPAHDGDLDALAARARAVRARTYTATAIGVFGVYEYAQDARHARVRFGTGDDTVMEMHGDHTTRPASSPEDLLSAPMTVCRHSGRECVRLTGEDDPGDKPHLFDTLTDSMVFQSAAAMASADLGPALLEDLQVPDLTLGVARVDSPAGPLDCAVATAGPGALADLEGQPLDPGRQAADSDRTALCVDARGLVVVSPGSFVPVTAYLSLTTSVQEGFDTVPFPVRPYPS
jgi:hypothetical protein